MNETPISVAETARFANGPTRGGRKRGSHLSARMESGERELRLHEIRFEPQCLFIMRGCVLRSACVFQGESQVVVRLSVIGLYPQRLLVLPNGFRDSACSLQDNRQIVVRLGEIRVDPQCLVVFPDRSEER